MGSWLSLVVEELGAGRLVAITQLEASANPDSGGCPQGHQAGAVLRHLMASLGVVGAERAPAVQLAWGGRNKVPQTRGLYNRS